VGDDKQGWDASGARRPPVLNCARPGGGRVDAVDLKSMALGLGACGFESHPGHWLDGAELGPPGNDRFGATEERAGEHLMGASR
jgi:hypothetical protein